MTTETVESLLADPNFDVEKFIHNVRLHSTRPIMRTLIEDPYVFLSIAESDDRSVLGRYPPQNFAVYDKLGEMGFETWVKVTGETRNWWRGVIVQDDLAIFGKKVAHNRVCFVYTGPKAAENARKRFKELKMHDKSKRETESLKAGERPVDLVRGIVMETISKFNPDNNYYSRRNDPAKSSFYFQLGKGGYRYNADPQHLNYKIIARGHSVQVKVEVAKKDPDYSKKLKAYNSRRNGNTTGVTYNYGYWNKPNEWISEWASVKFDMRKDPKSKTDKSYRTAQKVADDIIAFIRGNNVELEKKFLAKATV
jgi:hypothetical protein